jgi:hypothetical protein
MKIQPVEILRYDKGKRTNPSEYKSTKKQNPLHQRLPGDSSIPQADSARTVCILSLHTPSLGLATYRGEVKLRGALSPIARWFGMKDEVPAGDQFMDTGPADDGKCCIVVSSSGIAVFQAAYQTHWRPL